MTKHPATSRNVIPNVIPTLSSDMTKRQPNYLLQSSFNFISLPKELRLMVYDHLPRLVYRPISTAPGSPGSTIFCKDWTYETAILRTCREVHDEAQATIKRVLFKPLRMEVLVPNARSLKWLVPMFNAAQSLTQKAKDSTSAGTIGYCDTQMSQKTPESHTSPYRERANYRLRSATTISIMTQFGPLRSVVDPEMYLNNLHTNFSRLNHWASQHSGVKVQLTLMGSEGEDAAIVDNLRAVLGPSMLVLRWITVREEEFEGLRVGEPWDRGCMV